MRQGGEPWIFGWDISECAIERARRVFDKLSDEAHGTTLEFGLHLDNVAGDGGL